MQKCRGVVIELPFSSSIHTFLFHPMASHKADRRDGNSICKSQVLLMHAQRHGSSWECACSQTNLSFCCRANTGIRGHRARTAASHMELVGEEPRVADQECLDFNKRSSLCSPSVSLHRLHPLLPAQVFSVAKNRWIITSARNVGLMKGDGLGLATFGRHTDMVKHERHRRSYRCFVLITKYDISRK